MAWAADAAVVLAALLAGYVLLGFGVFEGAVVVAPIGGACLAWAGWYGLTKHGRPRGGSIGAAMMDVAVVQLPGGAACSRRRSTIRSLVGIALLAVPALEPVAILLSRRRQGIADRVVGTMVVDESAARARGTAPSRGRGWRDLLLAALAFGGAFVAIGVVHVAKGIAEARIHRADADVRALADCVDGFWYGNGRPPAALSEVTVEGQYCDRALDPWGRPYGYEPPGPGHPASAVVRTLGRDAAAGGDREDADVVEEVPGRPPR